MKRLQMKSPGSVLLSATGILFALLLSMASCKKSETATTAPGTDVDQITSILLGKMFTSDIQEAQDDDGLAFILNDGKDLLAVQKITPPFIATTGTIRNAIIIYSEYGILVHDNDTHQTWLYIQNTNESREKFNQVRAELSGDIVSTEIAGTIWLKLPNS